MTLREPETVRVALGSTASVKMEAAKRACTTVYGRSHVIGIKAVSAVPEQPVGDEETARGARARALYALEWNKRADFAIGIENGIVFEDGEWRDVAWVVVVLPDGRERAMRSRHVVFPTDLVEEALSDPERSVTVGSLIRRRHGGDAQDPHAILTGGAVNRMTLLEEAILTAIRDLPLTIKEEK